MLESELYSFNMFSRKYILFVFTLLVLLHPSAGKWNTISRVKVQFSENKSSQCIISCRWPKVRDEQEEVLGLHDWLQYNLLSADIWGRRWQILLCEKRWLHVLLWCLWLYWAKWVSFSPAVLTALLCKITYMFIVVWIAQQSNTVQSNARPLLPDTNF